MEFCNECGLLPSEHKYCNVVCPNKQMTDFHIKPKEYKPLEEKINTYKETKITKPKSEWKEFIEKRLLRMGLKKIKDV